MRIAGTLVRARGSAADKVRVLRDMPRSKSRLIRENDYSVTAYTTRVRCNYKRPARAKGTRTRVYFFYAFGPTTRGGKKPVGSRGVVEALVGPKCRKLSKCVRETNKFNRNSLRPAELNFV